MRNLEKRDIQKVKNSLDRFTEKYNISVADVLKLFESEEHVPITIFNQKLSPFETIAKFLRQNQGKTFKEISIILNKEVPACWTAYHNAIKKSPKKFVYLPSRFDIPLKELHSDRLSLLEIISSYLEDRLKLRFSEISKLLHRDERTIWTAYHRAMKKRRA